MSYYGQDERPGTHKERVEGLNQFFHWSLVAIGLCFLLVLFRLWMGK